MQVEDMPEECIFLSEQGVSWILVANIYLLTPFLWAVNFRVENVEAWWSDYGVVTTKTLHLQLDLDSLR